MVNLKENGKKFSDLGKEKKKAGKVEYLQLVRKS